MADNADVVQGHCQHKHNWWQKSFDSAHVGDQCSATFRVRTRYVPIFFTRNVKNAASVHEDFWTSVEEHTSAADNQTLHDWQLTGIHRLYNKNTASK